MSLIALCYVCSVGIYYNVYHFKMNEAIQNGQRDVTAMRVKIKTIISL